LRERKESLRKFLEELREQEEALEEVEEEMQRERRRAEEEGLREIEGELRERIAIRNELEEPPAFYSTLYDRAMRVLRTAQGLAVVALGLALVLVSFYAFSYEMVLTPEYQRMYEELKEFHRHSSFLEGKGIHVEKPRELAEMEAKVMEAIRLRERFEGKAIRGIEDVNPGLTLKRRVWVWKDRYEGWYKKPRTLEEMFFYSLPLAGVVLIAVVPLLAIQAVRGNKVFTVFNHNTGEKTTYIIDEELVGNLYHKVLNLWRLPVANPITLSFTGQYDIIPDDAFITEVRKGMRTAGIYAEPKPDIVDGLGLSRDSNPGNPGRLGPGSKGSSPIRRVYRAMPNTHGYFGELGFQKELNYNRTIDRLRMENIELKRMNSKLQAENNALKLMTEEEKWRQLDISKKHISEIGELFKGTLPRAKKPKKRYKRGPAEEEGEMEYE
jgi:hypothetical protein